MFMDVNFNNRNNVNQNKKHVSKIKNMHPCIRVNCSKYHCFALSMLINIVKHTYYFSGIGVWLDSLPLLLHSRCIYYVTPRVAVHINLLGIWD